MTAVELQCWCLFRQMGKIKKILNCATGQFAGHEREVSPSIKINAAFVCVQWGELETETALISVMFSLLESKKICIVYMTIVASGYSLRENRRQRFLILVTLVTNDLKTRQSVSILIKILKFSTFLTCSTTR